MELNEYWSAQAVEEYKGYLYEKKMQDYEYQCQRTAPHVIHNAKILKDGNQWCCILGDLPTGICGFGDTPEKACDEFDKVWFQGDKNLQFKRKE